MTQTAHTPGPWHICEATKRDLKLVRDDNGFCVAQAIQPGNSRAAYINAEANLHLIAAAPDLLMDMEDMAQWFASNGEVDGCFFDEATILGRIRETIAKARGMA